MPPWPPTPARETEQLIGEITIAGFDNIAERALLEPLTQVAKLTDGNTDTDGAACDKLKEIINTVNEKESAGQITSGQAEEFRDAAEDTMESLGCS